MIVECYETYLLNLSFAASILFLSCNLHEPLFTSKISIWLLNSLLHVSCFWTNGHCLLYVIEFWWKYFFMHAMMVLKIFEYSFKCFLGLIQNWCEVTTDFTCVQWCDLWLNTVFSFYSRSHVSCPYTVCVDDAMHSKSVHLNFTSLSFPCICWSIALDTARRFLLMWICHCFVDVLGVSLLLILCFIRFEVRF